VRREQGAVVVQLDEGLVRFVRPPLARVRPEVFMLEAPGGLWAEALALTAARDCLLVVQTQPRVPLLDALLTHAAATRMPIVAVVDLPNVAWARRSAQVVLPVIGASAGHACSAVAGASMLRLLVQQVVKRLCEPAPPAPARGRPGFSAAASVCRRSARPAPGRA
jgi:DNA-binding MurR/RpiR family transcriptional regulator